jgi:hypothetical protein
MDETLVPHLAASELRVSPASTIYVPPHIPPAWAPVGMARNVSRSKAKTEIWDRILRDISYLLEMENTGILTL